MADILRRLGRIDAEAYQVCGFIDRTGTIYPLGSDTKVLSTVFELIVRPEIYKMAERLGLKVNEAEKQNYYPDFTVLSDKGDENKIALDVKTTYRERTTDTFAYTLGGYTSFIRHPTKNILFPFDEYSDHLVIGFVYDRIGGKKAAANHTFTVSQLKDIPTPLSTVDVFVQEKWRIASGRAGSGNTTNIGSIDGTLGDFVKGRGEFKSEDEFLAYWRGYGRTSADRRGNYSTIAEFRRLQRQA
jgi:hypothetical protein